MKKIFLYLILFTTFSSAFSFDIWQSKITINKAISIAKSNNLPLHKSTLSAVSKGFQKKLLFLKEYPNNRLFQYHTVLLDKKATVYLYFTKDTKKLYKLKIRWSERGNELVKSIYTLLDKKYEKKEILLSSIGDFILSKQRQWKDKEETLIQSKIGMAGATILYIDIEETKKEEASKEKIKLEKQQKAINKDANKF